MSSPDLRVDASHLLFVLFGAGFRIVREGEGLIHLSRKGDGRAVAVPAEFRRAIPLSALESLLAAAGLAWGPEGEAIRAALRDGGASHQVPARWRLEADPAAGPGEPPAAPRPGEPPGKP